MTALLDVAKIVNVIRLIRKQVSGCVVPSVTKISRKRDPYRVLISCILSLRTKDKTTIDASNRLFKFAASPKDMVKLPVKRLEKIIYPVGFYRNKAKVILDISRTLIKSFNSGVPDKLDKLLEFKGVGRKTANLVLGLGFQIPAICVDTHVHRISNRLGWINTKSPEDSEEALKKIIPRNHWIELNTILVTFGQNLCLPVSPFCSRCAVNKFCARIGVTKSR